MKYFLRIIAFQKLLKRFNSIYRDVGSLHDKGRPDNNVEHSYRVAMLCWMIAEEYKLKLDITKVIQYALVHDLVEVYAGDVSIYQYKNYSKVQKNKESKEHKALLKLQKEFPQLKSLWKIIAEYEKRQDEESKFVYIIEKLEPIFIVILTEKDHWLKKRITMEDFIDMKQRKIKSIDSFAQKFNTEIIAYLRKNKRKFF
jgi:5'-deoxynucleotidase YfbR-like HD superfamily hydrolase